MTSNWRTYIVSELEKAGLLRVEDGSHGEYRPRQDEFAEAAHPIYIKIYENDKQSYTLAAIRDTRLQKLVSGEIRVKDAEKIMETAA
jgi:hypothetical protein